MSREKNPAMAALEERYPLGALSLTNDDGLIWSHRMAASESYYNDYSWDWKENQELLVDTRALEQKYGNYVMLARSIQQNFIASTYFRNPDPLIQDKGGDQDLSKMLSDMARSILAQTGSERKMKEALEDQWWAGFGFLWLSYRQNDKEICAACELDFESGDACAACGGATKKLKATKQQLLIKRMSPYRVRFDPEGREWDMSDHTYVAVFFRPTLKMLMEDRRYNDDDRRRIMATYRRGIEGDANFDWRSIRSTTVQDSFESDPAYIRPPCWQIWARPEKKIYTQIAGSQFTLTPLDWPEEFAEEDCFPGVYMPSAREVEDKEGTRGFIGIPQLREIKPNLFAFNRSESQFLAANQNAIFKYAVVKGALTPEQQAILSNDKQKAVIEWDPAALEAFPAQMRDNIKSFRDIFSLVEQPDLKESKHLEGMKHELDLVAQIIGQAPGDRGGMPDSPTATDSIIVDKRLKVREDTHKHEAGGFFKQLVKLIFLVLKQRQELPIPYQMTTQFNQKVWTTFSADKLRNLDLHYDYAVGSNEDKTRDEEFSMRERLATVCLPILQASGNLQDQMAIMRLLVDVLNINGTEGLLRSDVQDLIAQLTAISYGIQRGEIDPSNPTVAKQQMELIAQLGSRLLTPDKMAQIVTQSAGAPDQGPSQGEGSIAKPPTPGQSDFRAGAQGAAAAGAGGGMTQ